MRAIVFTPGYPAITCACCSTLNGSLGVCSPSRSSQSKPAAAQISVLSGPMRLTHKPYCVRFSFSAFLNAFTGVFIAVSLSYEAEFESAERPVIGVEHVAILCGHGARER